MFRRTFSSFGDVRTILTYSGKILKRQSGRLYRVSLLKIFSFPLGLSMIYITKSALDRGIFAGDLGIFMSLTVLGLCVFFSGRVLSYFADKIIHKVRARFSLDVNRDLTKRLFGLNYLKIKELSSAENTFILGYDYNTIEGLVFTEVPSFAALFKIPVFFALAAMFSWPLALLVLLSLPFIVLHTVWAARIKRRYRAREIFYSRKHGSCLHDTLLNMKLVKSLGKEEWAFTRVLSLFRRRVDSALDTSLFFHKSRFISNLFLRFNTALFWLLGGYFIIRGSLTFGAFSAVSMYTALIISEMYGISDIIQDLNEERLSIKRCSAFIREFSEREESSPVLPAAENPEFDRDLEFRDISFGYARDRMLFEGLSFVLPAGKWTLIRGRSGVGKTTLLSLFLRLFLPDRGGICLGDCDVDRISRNDFFKNISVVHQEPYLLNDTLMNNILLGEDRMGGKIEKALFCAGVPELAENLRLGYNCPVGESGSSLSGGQRQRIAIARALVREPRILVMDEATSFLEPPTEEGIFGNIKELFPSLTVIFVTHRDTARKFADEVFILEAGKMVKERRVSV
ncbi:MAG: ABC transporter ATP-binding protein [Candidatus Omnitrophica bacterium]|nr:ABC transporter ATP-binding protein [Candidatus Omnitrophota bacterium]